MSEMHGDETRKKAIGRVAGSGAAAVVEYSAAITGVDDLLGPAEVEHFIAPGFVDLQVNGFAGVDYNDPEVRSEELARSVRVIFRTGVTRLFPTIITGSEQRMTGALRNLTRAKHEWKRNGLPEAHAFEGFHVEGPHISPETGPRGAHPLEHIRPPDLEEFKRWQDAADGNVRLITVSPEWDGTPDYIRGIVRSGVVASIGHTKATTDQIQAAVGAGATMSTHLGNAAHPELPKTQNYLWDQLADDRLSASFILDGIHIPAAFFRAAHRAKGPERSILVTDAVMPAMCPPGFYKLGQVDVELRADGRVVMKDGARLAGSGLRMDHAIGNAVRFTGLPLSTILPAATTNAARTGRIAGRQRGLVAGDKADLVLFRWDTANFTLDVRETIIAGTSVYNAEAQPEPLAIRSGSNWA